MLLGNNVLFSAPTLEEVTLYIHKDWMVILTKFGYQQNLAGFGNCDKFEHSVEESFEIECRALLGVGTKQGNKRDVNLTKQYACTFALLKARIKPRPPSALYPCTQFPKTSLLTCQILFICQCLPSPIKSQSLFGASSWLSAVFLKSWKMVIIRTTCPHLCLHATKPMPESAFCNPMENTAIKKHTDGCAIFIKNYAPVTFKKIGKSF